jgi:DNA-binding MarR family transcriptional regulator
VDDAADEHDEDLTRLSAALERAASWIRRATPPGELNLLETSVLSALAADGPLRVTDLAARERVSQPGMTGIVARLAGAGLLAKRPDPEDRRAVLLEATEAGRAYLDARHAARARVFAARIATLPPDQRRALLATIDALTALTAERDDA